MKNIRSYIVIFVCSCMLQSCVQRKMRYNTEDYTLHAFENLLIKERTIHSIYSDTCDCLLVGSIKLGELNCSLSISSAQVEEDFLLLEGKLIDIMTKESIPYGSVHIGNEYSDTIFLKQIGLTNKEGMFNLKIPKEENAIYFVSIAFMPLKVEFHFKD